MKLVKIETLMILENLDCLKFLLDFVWTWVRFVEIEIYAFGKFVCFLDFGLISFEIG